MTITKHTVAEKIPSCLHHDISLADLVSWAEDAVIDGEFEQNESPMISVVATRDKDLIHAV